MFTEFLREPVAKLTPDENRIMQSLVLGSQRLPRESAGRCERDEGVKWQDCRIAPV